MENGTAGKELGIGVRRRHMESLPGHPKGSVGAGDHEPVGIQVYMGLYNFLPQPSGAPN